MTMRFDTRLPATGKLQLPVCRACGSVNYPVRALCGHCLADALDWQFVDDRATVQSLCELHYCLEQDYREHLPWTVASVQLACGPTAFAHVQAGLDVGDPVVLCIRADRHGNHMLVAQDKDNNSDWLTAIQFREEPP